MLLIQNQLFEKNILTELVIDSTVLIIDSIMLIIFRIHLF